MLMGRRDVFLYLHNISITGSYIGYRQNTFIVENIKSKKAAARTGGSTKFFKEAMKWRIRRLFFIFPE